MQQVNSSATPSDTDTQDPNAIKDESIWESQNFMIGCLEMERITDDVLVPVFLHLAKAIKANELPVDIVLMDCESPLDNELYNVGVRLNFSQEEEEYEVSMVADPSDFTFTLQFEGASEEPLSKVFQYHETIPRVIEAELKKHFVEHLPVITYEAEMEKSDQAFEKFVAPFRVQYNDHGTVSDVATTQTLLEAAHMGGTFAKMFKKEEAISIIDANDAIIC
ncbi:hypothetical protein [Rubritalea sp.]|uniref:hypothetical protein n=1 Tax=Rubritalea sp. TaxID=2109375 RepID=UPI003EF6B009